MLLVQEGSTADHLVSALFLMLCLHMARTFSSDMDLTKRFIALTAGVVCTILALKWMGDKTGMAVSNSLPHTPFKKSKKMLAKWRDQTWQIFAHMGFAAWAWHLISQTDLWENPWNCWKPCNADERVISSSFEAFYLAQLGKAMFTAFSCAFLEEHRKDHIEMMLHHVVTAALIYGSMLNGYMQIGLLVVFVHDLSDVPLDFMLMANMLELEGPKCLFFVELSFVANAIR
jgi:ceramide synthetase